MEAERILLKWLKTSIGAQLQREILHHVQKLVKPGQGSYLLSLGLPDSTETLRDLRVPFKWSLAETLNEPIYYDGLAHFDALPFPDKLFDFVIVAYPGLYPNDLSLFLQEIERILTPDGHLLWFDVHPWSLLGYTFKRFVKQRGGKYRFHSLSPLCRRMKQNHFRITEMDNFFYRIPTQNEQLLHRLKFMETIGPLSLIMPAGCYGICARKTNYNVIPVADKWVNTLETDEKLELIS